MHDRAKEAHGEIGVLDGPFAGGDEGKREQGQKAEENRCYKMTTRVFTQNLPLRIGL